MFWIHLQTFRSYISVFYLNDFNNVNSTRNFKFNIFNFAEKSKTHCDAFEDASYIPHSFQEFGNKRESTQCQRQCSQIVDENYPLFTIFTIFTIFSNKNQFVKHNLEKFWNYYFFKYFLELWYIKKFSTLYLTNCFLLRLLLYISKLYWPS